MQKFEGDSGKPHHEDRKYKKLYEIGGNEIPAMKWIPMYRTLTSINSHPPLAQYDFTERSFLPEEAACNGNKISREYLWSPMSSKRLGNRTLGKQV